MDLQTTGTNEKCVIDKTDGLTRQLAKKWLGAKKAKNVWNFRDFDKEQRAYATVLTELMALWPGCETQWAQDVQDAQGYVQSDEYRTEVEQALKEAGVPLQGEFPTYELPPFKLHISIDCSEVKLSMGRKQEKTTIMHPKTMAAWVVKHYQAVTNKKFDALAFMKELLNAYKFANKAAYQETEVLWGRAVGLDVIYELLTIKRVAKQDYPRPLFVYELGRLKEQFNLTLDDYRFELGFARNQSKALLIVDSQGRENRVSSLTIYKVVES